MKKFSFVFSALVIMLLFGCKKSDLNNVSPNLLIKEAKEYFSSAQQSQSVIRSQGLITRNFKNNSSFIPLWDLARFEYYSNKQALIIPIKYAETVLFKSNLSDKRLFNANDATYLLFYKNDSQTPQMVLLTYIPDSTNSQPSTKFAGILVKQNLNNQSAENLKFEKDGSIRKFVTEEQTEDVIMGEEAIKTFSSPITICYEISGFNYSVDDPEGYHWREFVGCRTYFVDAKDGSDGGGPSSGDYGDWGGGAGSPGIPSLEIPGVLSGPSIIGNIHDYNKCFTNRPGENYDYKVTVCVSQPVPGTRETWGFAGNSSSATGNPVSVGHTYLVLEQSTHLSSIVRNVGLYPQNGAHPLSPTDQGQLNNDSQRGYDVSLTISVNSSEFTTILNYINNNANVIYDLNSNNCTSFALNALSSAGYNLPRTKGSWANGGGVNPGDFGEDLRAMDLQPYMSRNTVFNNHPNKGNCQ